jgi:hypothetical protein
MRFGVRACVVRVRLRVRFDVRMRASASISARFRTNAESAMHGKIGTLATEASFIRFACLYSTSGLWNAAAWTGAMYAMAGITFCGGSRKPFHQCMRSARKANLVGHSDLGCEVILNEERDKVTPNEAAAS